MLLIKACLLWILVAVHVVGIAFVFRRKFPGEPRWLAFFVPELVIVALCNFVEHHMALTQMRLLLPLSTASCVAAIVWPKPPWRTMRFPALLFLAAFAFTFALRAIRPDIIDARDGAPDLGVMANFLYGQTLPAESTWLPPIKMINYYCLEHYGASLLTRLFGVDIGTGFNLSVALLSAYLYFLSGAVAWHLGRGKIWIVVLTLVLTAGAATGTSGFLWLNVRNLDPENTLDPYVLFDTPATSSNWLAHELAPISFYYNRHLLIPPGYGTWMGCLHSVQSGQILLASLILVLIEVSRRRKTNWPWILLLVSPLYMLTTCTWGLPFVAFLIASGLVICWSKARAPKDLPFVLIAAAAWAILFEPMLTYFLDPMPFSAFKFSHATQLHTEVVEFFAQWWPVFLPWAFLLFAVRRLHIVSVAVLAMTPLAFLGTENWNYGVRLDATGKLWGLTFAAIWIVVLPELARRPGWAFRIVLLLVVVNSGLSLYFWSDYYWRVAPRDDIAHLEGHGQLNDDRRKARILEILSHLHDQTIISGKAEWAFSESSLLPLFSHNRTYVAWTNFSDTILYPTGISEAVRRAFEVNGILSGKNSEPLFFLRQQNIAALVIYPDDDIDSSVVDHLRRVLAPYYTFEDANYRTPAQLAAGTLSPSRPCAGVFLYRPEITRILGPPGVSPE
jgi:hypothetical protein